MGIKQIFYGVGQVIIKDFKDPTKFVCQSDIQDLTFETSESYDDITGGNKIFPIASFPKDKGVKVSATNATFDAAIAEYTTGVSPVAGKHKLPVAKSFAIPADGTVTLEQVPVGDVLVQGMTAASGSAEPTAGQFKVDSVTKTVKFATADAGKMAKMLYYYDSTEKCAGFDTTMSTTKKPFVFEYIKDIYDEDNAIVGKLFIEVYKMQMTTGFSLDDKHQTAFAPKWEAQAKDPNRPDGKLWSLYLDGIEI